MFRPLFLFIGLRYMRTRRRSPFLSFIANVSIVGISLSVLTLITVMSVMNGFDQQLRAHMIGAVSHVTISARWMDPLADLPTLRRLAQSVPHVTGTAPYVETQAMLMANATTGAIVRGIDPDQEAQVDDLGKHMIAGQLSDLDKERWGIVLGKDLAATLGVKVGDRLTVIVPSAHATPLGAVPRSKRFTVRGVFMMDTQMADAGLALISLPDAEALTETYGPSGLRLRLDDIFQAAAVRLALKQKLQNVNLPYNLRMQLEEGMVISTWQDTQASLFQALAMEKTVMFVILSLIVLVAVINLISMLMMGVTEKQADIAILRTLGANPLEIMGVFMVQGLGVGLLGISLGTLGGCVLSWRLPALLSWVERTFHVTFLSPDVYYISEVPSHLQFSDVAWVIGVAMALSLLATLYPAGRAAKTLPAQALRYE